MQKTSAVFIRTAFTTAIAAGIRSREFPAAQIRAATPHFRTPHGLTIKNPELQPTCFENVVGAT